MESSPHVYDSFFSSMAKRFNIDLNKLEQDQKYKIIPKKLIWEMMKRYYDETTTVDKDVFDKKMAISFYFKDVDEADKFSNTATHGILEYFRKLLVEDGKNPMDYIFSFNVSSLHVDGKPLVTLTLE